MARNVGEMLMDPGRKQLSRSQGAVLLGQGGKEFFYWKISVRCQSKNPENAPWQFASFLFLRNHSEKSCSAAASNFFFSESPQGVDRFSSTCRQPGKAESLALLVR